MSDGRGQNRYDLTNWLFHFVRDARKLSEPNQRYEEYFDESGRQAMYFNEEIKPIFSDNDYYVHGMSDLFGDKTPLGIIKRIIMEGFIRPSWAFRNGVPTIYGSRSAICFTEMPLGSLIEYVSSGINENNTSMYGIALLRNELFASGARNAIYGLSNEYEIDHNSYFRSIKFEYLVDNEQYRYVSTNLSKSRYIDWTHEREWRWTFDKKDTDSCPGLPIWFCDGVKTQFSKVIVLVKTTKERIDFLSLLKQSFDSHGNVFGLEFNIQLLRNTYVVCVDEISELSKIARFEDLKAENLDSITIDPPSADVLEKVRIAVEKAKIASGVEADFQELVMPKALMGGVAGNCGFTWVKTDDGNSEITRALLALKVARSGAGEGYYVYAYSMGRVGGTNLMIKELQEKAASKAASVLMEELGQKFYVYSKYD